MKILIYATTALLLLTTSGRAESFPSSDCLECHQDPDLTKTVGGEEISLAVEAGKFAASVHGFLDCTDCHEGIGDLLHDEDLPTVDCSVCHDDASSDYLTSVHGASRSMGESAAATCADCHGAHDIVPVKQGDSPVFKFNLARTCAKCHDNEGLTRDYGIRQPDAVTHFAESIHGRGLLQMGLIVAPSCNDCHGVHDIKPGNHRNSPVHHSKIANTCGKCHLGVEQIYNESVHGQLLLNGDPNGPVCTDCHNAHEIEAPSDAHFKAVSDQKCGSCHEDRLLHYRDTYHGKAIALGKPNVASSVAACYDCHGHHDVYPRADPRSKLSADNIEATCQSCHPGANGQFAGYLPHANPLDPENYPLLNKAFIFMTALLIGVFGFFGVHTAFWGALTARAFLRDSREFRAVRNLEKDESEWFTRFSPFERFLHFLVVTSFLLLVITGMPLKFYYTDWAKSIFNVLGGVEVARSLHHFGAIVTFLYFALHLFDLATRFWKGRRKIRDPETGKFRLKLLWTAVFGPDSMVPSFQDWHDFVAHLKWFTGRGPRPEFDRWTYWEKFDYFSVFWGVAIIGLSGLVLWFPKFFTLFLPGWSINVALIVHSDEALLAAGFIFAFHFFNTHFRIEKFPMDTVIFSGRISKAEMLHERRRWYDRLVADGRLDDYRVRDEWEKWKKIARTFGYLFFGVGVVLLILIIYAMVLRLGH